MTAGQMWERYIQKTPENKSASYEAWSYGAAPDELAELTLKGVKTATASCFDMYRIENSPVPEAGAFSVILGSGDEAVCVIRTERVTVLPFSQVGAKHAYMEGEGDRDLEYWRRVHKRFFTAELEEAGLSFSEDIPVVCEKFKRVYPR